MTETMRRQTPAADLKNLSKPELLAPAGGMEQLKAAVRFGADAVYLGAQKFGLRAFAGNFNEDDLSAAVDFAHGKGVKVYVTVNAFLYDDDISGVKKTFEQVQKSGADAAIISDFAALTLAKEAAPGLKLHISTQANTLNSMGALHWHQLGASRIILARELSLDRIAKMRQNLPEGLELEAFVHGAMCVSYSGRCVLSNHLSGRDANQGQCAQPCRWKYALVEEKRPGEYMPVFEDEKGSYIYSANDLCMIEHIDKLCAAGLGSLKIEGRMKTEYYVATVVSAYRKAIDSFFESPDLYRSIKDELKNEVCRASHRPLSTGFYFGRPSPTVSSDYSQDSVYVAAVLSYDNESKTAAIRQKNRFFSGEELALLSPAGTRPIKISGLRDEEGNEVESAPHPMQRLTIDAPFPMNEGDIIRRDVIKK
ncbi:MAG: peptidase U32 family protein [Christensenellales bacterium]